MSFDSLQSFIAMGGHGPYVWGSYLVAAVVVAYNVVSPVIARRRVITDAQDAMRRESSG